MIRVSLWTPFSMAWLIREALSSWIPVQATASGNGPDPGMMSFSALPASAAIARSREKFQSACRHISLHSSRICLHKKYFAQQGVDVFRVFTVLKKRIQFLQKDITCFLEVDEREECAVPPLRDQFEGDKDLCAVRIVHGSAVP